MATKKKMLEAAAGGAGGAGLDITEVFSTYLYEGTGSARSIVNEIDLAGEGGLTWIKQRNGSQIHVLFDTERGATKYLTSTATQPTETQADALTSFNSNGFSLGDDQNGGYVNYSSSQTYASWTFRKAPKFFDIVQYTGNGATHRDVPHNLESAPGWVITKRIDAADNWQVYSKASAVEYKLHWLNTTDATHVNYNPSNANYNWTDTVFYASSQYSFANTNANGVSYVSYLFANHDGDGTFGPDGDQDIIKCGSYAHAYAGTEVNLGFEPQWILFKAADQAGKNWFIFDAMRGIVTGGLSGDGDAALFPNTSGAENVNTWGVDLTATGFIAYGNNIASSGNIIYLAIRRGPLAPPEAGTEVFAMDTLGGTSPNPPGFYSGWPVDLALITRRAEAEPRTVYDRLRGSSVELRTNDTSAEQSATNALFDQMNGYYEGGSVVSDIFSWMWKRAPGFFDCVAYSGNGTAGRTVSHNLGVAPEMMWVKERSGNSGGRNWAVYHSALGSTKYLFLNTTAAVATASGAWNNTNPTSSVFSVGTANDTNKSNGTYVAYLFASLAGVSKVGSFTATGSVLNIDCGFTSGARFVLIKRTDTTGDWFLFDSVRGITTSAAPYLYLNSTGVESTGNYIDPLASGFKVNTSFYGSGDFIFYAIA